jgi:hypothetical protein
MLNLTYSQLSNPVPGIGMGFLDTTCVFVVQAPGRPELRGRETDLRLDSPFSAFASSNRFRRASSWRATSGMPLSEKGHPQADPRPRPTGI